MKTNIKYEKIFEIPVLTFKEYAKENGIFFDEGDGGIYLNKDINLGEEESRAERKDGGIKISASTEKGMHIALAKLLGKIKKSDDGIEIDAFEGVNPDMHYRALSVDLARQIHPVKYIFKYIDTCYLSCATHLQLHFTDNESFTLPMKAYPKLSTEGKTYTYEEIQSICDYAESRGIELIPEVDLPGHTKQFCDKYPELFGTLNILPADEEVFAAIKTIYSEVCDMFKNSPWIHIGGDEAQIERWNECEKTRAYMKKNGIKDVNEMYGEYIRIATEIIFELGRTPVVWEGFSKEYNDRISKDVIVICWEYLYQRAEDLAASGFTLINASWVPLYIVTARKEWYWKTEDIKNNWDPWTWRNWWNKSLAYPDGAKIDRDKSNVIGAQICAWGDGLRNLVNWESGVKEELCRIQEKLPVLCEKLINLD